MKGGENERQMRQRERMRKGGKENYLLVKKKRQRRKKRERVTHQPFNKDHNSQTFSFRAKSKVDPFNKKHSREHTENLLCKKWRDAEMRQIKYIFSSKWSVQCSFFLFYQNFKKEINKFFLVYIQPSQRLNKEDILVFAEKPWMHQ